MKGFEEFGGAFTKTVPGEYFVLVDRVEGGKWRAKVYFSCGFDLTVGPVYYEPEDAWQALKDRFVVGKDCLKNTRLF